MQWFTALYLELARQLRIASVLVTDWFRKRSARNAIQPNRCQAQASASSVKTTGLKTLNPGFSLSGWPVIREVQTKLAGYN